MFKPRIFFCCDVPGWLLGTLVKNQSCRILKPMQTTYPFWNLPLFEKKLWHGIIIVGVLIFISCQNPSFKMQNASFKFLNNQSLSHTLSLPLLLFAARAWIPSSTPCSSWETRKRRQLTTLTGSKPSLAGSKTWWTSQRRRGRSRTQTSSCRFSTSTRSSSHKVRT